MSDSYEFLKAHFDRIRDEDIDARAKLLADHSQAMEFVREIAAVACDDADCGHCLPCRASRWLNSESPQATNAVDPHAQPSGTPTPRDGNSSSSRSGS